MSRLFRIISNYGLLARVQCMMMVTVVVSSTVIIGLGWTATRSLIVSVVVTRIFA